jgi:hypothetical protein
MPDSLRISAKNLGALALPDFCPRCFWLKSRTKVLPFQIFPGIFSSIDSYTKRVVHAWIDANGNAPFGLRRRGQIFTSQVESSRLGARVSSCIPALDPGHDPDVLASLADRVMSPQTGTQTLLRGGREGREFWGRNTKPGFDSVLCPRKPSPPLRKSVRRQRWLEKRGE